MFTYFRGKLVSAQPTEAIVEVGGIGYLIAIPVSVFGKLPQIGSEVVLYTSFVVRELSHALYGFLSPQERDVFEILLSVTGVGPKLALSITGHLSTYELQQAVQRSDTATLSRVPGIGKKSAERLIIELRGKLDPLVPPDPTDFAALALSDPKARQVQDAMSALINLGYNQQTAQKAVQKTLTEVPETLHLAEFITYALKHT